MDEATSFSCRLQDSYGTVTVIVQLVEDLAHAAEEAGISKGPHRWEPPCCLSGASVQLLSQRKTPASLPSPPTISLIRSGTNGHYRGQITEGPLQTIEHKFFTNVSSVTGTKTIKGMAVSVFHDTNPGNHGPSDSFYRRDSVGIVYYGSEPGTPLEKQLVPYQIVRFPMKVSIVVPAIQSERDGLWHRYGSGRRSTKRPMRKATATVVGQESVTVPAGTFKDAVKVEARMYMQIHLSGANRTAHWNRCDGRLVCERRGFGQVCRAAGTLAVGRPRRSHGDHGGTGILRDQAAEGLTRAARILDGGSVR